MKEMLNMKQDELEKSKMTAEELNKEEGKLKENVRKVEELEEKIRTEMDTLKEKLKEMKQDMKTFSDLDSLRDAANLKKAELQERQEELKNKKVGHERRISILFRGKKKYTEILFALKITLFSVPRKMVL